MSQHTPGPWIMTPALDGQYYEVGQANPPKYRGDMCHVFDAEHIGGITREETIANARLIAAAPDLLSAAKVLLDGEFERECSERAEAFFEMLAQAVAKAEGRS